jgi:nucleoside-diphosphate-sugar epimerase
MVSDLIAMCRVPVRVEPDPALLRPTDVPRQEADTRKFTELTGWQPRIPWHTTLLDTLEYWRARVLQDSPQLLPGP